MRLAALDVCVVVALLGLAGWALLARTALAAVVSFVAYGLALSLAWVRLGSIDVALTEAAIGSGVTGLLLLRATSRLRQPDIDERPNRPLRLVAGLLCGALAVGLAVLVLAAVHPAPSLAVPAVDGLAKLGLGNAVTGVLVAYRAIDTLLESVVLIPALLGVWSLAPDRLWRGAPTLRLGPVGPPLLFTGQILIPIGVLVGAYVVWVGATGPGGAFQGGTILAAMLILAMMSGLHAPSAITDGRLRCVLVAGPALFVLVGLAGFVFAGGFLAYPVVVAKPLIVAIEAALTVSIAVALALLAAGPPARVAAA